MYTAEGGYCESDDAKKEYFYNLVLNGVKYATALDMYVIIDWHMVGATDVNDRNPLYYKDEAVDFFSRISYELKDYNNVLYEIMNEPCGDTTWEMCKRYANAVIPAIRENTDAIILVGNPHWSADLASVLASPLEGYDNIMYTYHFYAGSISSTNSLIKAYDAGLPIFVSEYGGMDSDGDGAISYESINNWYRVLDERNISYVAWNISNSAGSASILLQTSSSLTDFSDSALKEWGIYLKQILRKKANLPDEW
jgi:endoglucanase